MTADPTAPKIDTTAPERVYGFIDADLGGSRYEFSTSHADDADVEYIRADLAAAQTAAAVREMREALLPTIKANCRICGGSGYSGGSGGTGNAKTTLYPCEHGVSHITLPVDTQAALDRLLDAARQDERTAIAAYIGMSPSEVTDRQYHMEAIRTGLYRDDPLMQRGGRMEGGDSGETDR